MPPATTMTGVACLDRLRAERDGTKTRAADHVHGDGADFGRKPAVESGLTRGVLSKTGGDDVAHDAFIDLLGLKVRAPDGFPDHDRTEPRGGDVRKRALEFPDRSADPGDDNDLIHGYSLYDSMRETGE